MLNGGHKGRRNHSAAPDATLPTGRNLAEQNGADLKQSNRNAGVEMLNSSSVVRPMKRNRKGLGCWKKLRIYDT